MELHISDQAFDWYKNELELNGGESIRFYVRYGGVGGIVPGFSIAIRFDTPVKPIAKERKSEVDFFIEEDDKWYFDEKDLYVEFDPDLAEPTFKYGQ